MFAAIESDNRHLSESAIDQFEDALFRGERPDIRQYLPTGGERRAVLVELVHIDLERRLKSGDAVRAEHYLSQFPELATDQGLAVDLIAAEYEFRSRSESDLTPDSYLDRFPQYAGCVKSRLAELSAFPAQPTKIRTAPSPSQAPGPTSAGAAELSDVVLAPGAKDLPMAKVRDYRIVDRLGGGGMGVVYRAVHQRLNKTVAIKVLSPQLTDDAHAVSRFEREMQAVGKLDHPNIVRATDAGEFDGRHYLVMEYVEGPTLADVSKQIGPLPIADACELVRQAAQALDHVRQAGLVHRDIKPSNLMLTRQGQVKLLDLGLARLHERAGDGAELTSTGQMMGTFDYMAPEQVDSSHEVDIRADIYGLGCTLYKLLCGEAPFGGTAYDTPARKLRALLDEAVVPIDKRRDDLPADLAGVVQRMLAKSPNKRFQTPNEVAEALQPFAKNADLSKLLSSVVRGPAAVPGDASKPSTVHPVASAIEDTQPHIAPVTRHRPRLAPLVAWSRSRRRLVVSVALLVLLSMVGLAAFSTFGRRGSPGREDHSSLSRSALVSSPAKIKGLTSWTIETITHRGPIKSVAYSPDGKLLASYGQDATIRVWDLKTGELARALVGQGLPAEGRQGAAPYCLAWSADSQVLAAASYSGPNQWSVQLWDVNAGRAKKPLQMNSQVATVALSPNGKTIATGFQNTVRLWQADSGELLDQFVADKVGDNPQDNRGLCWSPDGKSIASLVLPGRVYIWDVKSAKAFRTLETGAAPKGIGWSTDSKRLAVSGSGRDPAQILDVASGKVSRVEGAEGVVSWQDANKIVAFGRKLFSVSDGKLVRSLSQPDIALHAWSPDGKTFASYDDLGNLSIYDGSTGKLVHSQPGNAGTFSNAAWSHDGRFLCALGGIWDLKSGRVVTRYAADLFPLAYSRDDRFVSMAQGYGVRIMDAQTGELLPMRPELFTGAMEDGFRRVVWSEDGNALLGATDAGRIKIVDLESNKSRVNLDGQLSNLTGLAWSPDNDRIAGFSEGSSKVHIWDAKTGKQLDVLETKATVEALNWGPNGRLAAGISKGDDRKILIWDADRTKNAKALDLPPIPGGLREVCWTADGKKFVVSTKYGNWLFIDAVDGNVVRDAFLPISGFLATDKLRTIGGGSDARMRISNLEIGLPVADIVALANQTSLVISPEGHYAGPSSARRQIVYVAQIDDGQETLVPDEFEKKFGWHNDVDKVRLVK